MPATCQGKRCTLHEFPTRRKVGVWASRLALRSCAPRSPKVLLNEVARAGISSLRLRCASASGTIPSAPPHASRRVLASLRRRPNLLTTRQKGEIVDRHRLDKKYPVWLNCLIILPGVHY